MHAGITSIALLNLVSLGPLNSKNVPTPLLMVNCSLQDTSEGTVMYCNYSAVAT